jgi:hypothetical protein
MPVLIKIREGFKESGQSERQANSLKIPSEIYFIEDGNNLKMGMSGQAVCANMQKDGCAFEGWAIVSRQWGQYKKVILKWEKPKNPSNGHYQRFLFRVSNFSQQFKSWFSIDQKCEAMLKDLETSKAQTLLLNMPSQSRVI